MPVHYNPNTREPYLRLPTPHSNIILTPYRLDQMEETCARLCQYLNDPRVYLWLAGPPYPYLREHGEEWVKTKCEQHEKVLSALRKEFEAPQSQNGTRSDQQQDEEFFDACPFSCIREVLDEDSETGVPLRDVLIGDVGIMRYSFYEFPHGSEERAEAQRKNNALPAGDERIVWCIGGRFDCIRVICLFADRFGRFPSSLSPWQRYHDSCDANCHS